MKPARTTQSTFAWTSASQTAASQAVAVGRDSRVEERGRNVLVGGEAKRVARPIGQHEPDLAAQQAALLEARSARRFVPTPETQNRDSAAHAST